jgi:hypothetical protein
MQELQAKEILITKSLFDLGLSYFLVYRSDLSGVAR